MKQFYELANGKVSEIEVNSAVAELLATIEREDRNEARNKRRRKEVSIEAARGNGLGACRHVRRY